MREAGFEDVTDKRVFVPLNPWACGRKSKLLGFISLQYLSKVNASLSTAAFIRVLGRNPARLK